MKLVIKRLGCAQVGNVVNGANVSVSYCAHSRHGTTATLKFYGIEEGAVLTVVFTPNIDMDSNLVRAVRDILGPSYPKAAIPPIIVHFKYFLAKSVEDDLSLDELEKYAKIRNMTRSPLVTKDPNM
uniref:Uncharacterized protein n=1 Tax=Parascaris equorum TaxID=6256 RepID=A0A914RDS5_PAREQ